MFPAFPSLDALSCVLTSAHVHVDETDSDKHVDENKKLATKESLLGTGLVCDPPKN